MPPHLEPAQILEQARVAHMRAVNRTTRPRTTPNDWARITVFDGTIDHDPAGQSAESLLAAS